MNIIRIKMVLQQNSFYTATEILIVWHLRRIAPRLEALLSVTSSTHANSVTISSVMWIYRAIVMAPKESKMSKQVGNT